MSIPLLIIGFFIIGGTFGAFLMAIFIGGNQQSERQDYIAGLRDDYKQAKKELNQTDDNSFTIAKKQKEERKARLLEMSADEYEYQEGDEWIF